MSHAEDRFTAPDNLLLYESRWLPEGETRGCVVFVHGFTEHSGRYSELFESLRQHGYVVWTMDLRGHGKSQGDRVYIRSFDQYLDDLDLLLARVRRDWAELPLFLVGHSMGAAIVLLSAMHRRPDAKGVVASAPPVQVGGAVFPTLRHLASAVARLFPRLRLVSLGGNFVSRDPDVVEHFQNDPLVHHGRFPVRTGSEILRASRQIRRGMAQLDMPLLILHGTGDVVTSAAGSQRLFDEAASADKTLKLYEGLYHDLFHEPERLQITAELIEWLDARVEHAASTMEA